MNQKVPTYDITEILVSPKLDSPLLPTASPFCIGDRSPRPFVKVLITVGIVLCLPLVLIISLVAIAYLLCSKFYQILWLKWKRHQRGCRDESEISWDASTRHKKMKKKIRIHYSTCYLTMRDGVKIATDLYVPLEHGAKVVDGRPELLRTIPCIFHQTRYHRSMALKWPLNLINNGRPFSFMSTAYFDAFLHAGFAVVSIDVRGTGASFGTHVLPWDMAEQLDSLQVLDWISDQPWSDGKVGLWGVSYEATAAMFTIAHQHPAVKASVPMYMFYDIYHDVACPGGISQHHFPTLWQAFNSAVDNDRLDLVLTVAKYMVEGVTPASNMTDLRAAIKEHQSNWNAKDDLNAKLYRDSTALSTGVTIGSVSPYNVQHDLRRIATPVYFYSGWYDCTARSALQGYLTCPESSLIIGPWNHGGIQHIRPDSCASFASFDHVQETVGFFVNHLMESDVKRTSREVHYYCMGEGRWNHCSQWPPPGTYVIDFHLGTFNQLCAGQSNIKRGAYSLDVKAGQCFPTGNSRWDVMINSFDLMHYKNWHKCEHIIFESEVLKEDLKVVGTPSIDLLLSSTDDNADIFVYLLVISKKSKNPCYVTEGHFRASFRKEESNPSLENLPQVPQPHAPNHSFLEKDEQPLVPFEETRVHFDLMPVAYLFKKGSKIRIAISGSDRKHFTSGLSPGNSRHIKIHFGTEQSSILKLPAVPLNDDLNDEEPS